jgi:hypothetical protein
MWNVNRCHICYIVMTRKKQIFIKLVIYFIYKTWLWTRRWFVWLLVFKIICLFFKSLIGLTLTRATVYEINLLSFITEYTYRINVHTLWLVHFFIFRTFPSHICSSVELRELCKLVEILTNTIMLLICS